MKYRPGIGCVLIVLLATATAHGEERCGPRDRVILNAVLTQTTCTVEVPVKKDYTVQTKDVATEVPITHLVPVCVKDPCTGQTRTEWRPQTVMRKATATYILVLPPDPPEEMKKEERKKMIFTVTIGRAAAPQPSAVPPQREK